MLLLYQLFVLFAILRLSRKIRRCGQRKVSWNYEIMLGILTQNVPLLWFTKIFIPSIIMPMYIFCRQRPSGLDANQEFKT